VALSEREAHLVGARAAADRAERLRRFLMDEAWPQIPAGMLGNAPGKPEREEILGYGPEGV